MRVLLISPLPPPPGGDSTWTVNYLNYAKKVGYKVNIVNTAVIGSRALSVNGANRIYDEIKRSLLIWYNINKAIKIFRPDIVHINTNCSPQGLIRDYIEARIIESKRIPFVIHCHCNVPDQIKNSQIGLFFLRKIANMAHAVITLNDASKKYAEGITKHHVVIIPNFIDTSYLIEKPKVISRYLKKILFVGHVRKSKGVTELAEAANSYTDIEFQLVGPITDEMSGYEFPQNVKIYGSVSEMEVKRLLIGADIFLFPTYTEGFSVSLLEAMSMGVPIIATDVGANKYMIENKGGVIIPPQNSQAIIEAINYLKDRKIRSQMSQWNIKKVKEHFTCESVIAEYMKLYELKSAEGIKNRTGG